MNQTIHYTKATAADYPAVVALLQSHQLPVEDISTELDGFRLAKVQGKTVACIGLERWGTIGLLRSMSTGQGFQKKGIASELVRQLTDQARSEGISALYLLTQTAEPFFSHRGFSVINRSEAPHAIRNTKEFSSLCPASAVLMKMQML